MRLYRDEDFPADPYPGAAPGTSYVHVDAAGHPLVPDPAARGGWSVLPDSGDAVAVALDAWLADRGAAPMAARVPVLTYGSNRCPSKLTWLRRRLGLAGPVVVLRAEVEDLAAVWAAGRRARDGARPATLALDPGRRETHAVWFATPAQVAVLDACEGRGERYDLARLHVGRVRTEDGAELGDPWVYWPADDRRAPLLVDGAPVRCGDLGQDAARGLVGEPAALPPGATTTQVGAPDPDSWPDAVFVYGTLQPGRVAWRLVAPYARGTGWAAWTAGRVVDTGRGYPALLPPPPESAPPGRPGPDQASSNQPTDSAGADQSRSGHGTPRAEGMVVALSNHASALPALDAYEGSAYRRARGIAYPSSSSSSSAAHPNSGCPVWLWMWEGPVDRGWVPVQGPWTGTAGTPRGARSPTET